MNIVLASVAFQSRLIEQRKKLNGVDIIHRDGLIEMFQRNSTEATNNYDCNLKKYF